MLTYIILLNSCDLVFSSADQVDALDLIEEVLSSSLGWNAWFSSVQANAGFVL